MLVGMTETKPTDVTPVTLTAADDLAAMAPPVEDQIASTAGMSRRLKTAGIVTTAVVVGFVGVLTVQGSSASPSPSNGPGGVGGAGAFRGQGGPPGFAARGLQGTVDAISPSSITVSGTTVKVTSATQVVVNGAPGALSDVTKGATVFVLTEGTGSARSAERILVGMGGPGFGPPPAGPQGAVDRT